MGLTAAVYRRLEAVHFPPGTDLKQIQIDKDTGEIYYEDRHNPKIERNDLISVKKRLGNMSMIAYLRQQVAEILGRESHSSSILLGKVLYNGTHGGDVLPSADHEALKQEISFIRDKSRHRRSAELEDFLSKMDDLIATSEEQGNPIVFL